MDLGWLGVQFQQEVETPIPHRWAIAWVDGEAAKFEAEHVAVSIPNSSVNRTGT